MSHKSLVTTRQGRGQVKAQIGGIVMRVSEYEYLINSQSEKDDYQVLSIEMGWLCSCPDHVYYCINYFKS